MTERAVTAAVADLRALTTCECPVAPLEEHEDDCRSHFRDDVDVLVKEIARRRAALELEVSRRCLGGTPPAVDENWANRKLEPPDSASTGPTAPPGMRASNDHLPRSE